MLTGGGSKLPGVVELLKDELKLSAQVGLSQPNLFETKAQGMREVLESPEYVSVLGLLLWSKELEPRRAPMIQGNFLMNFLRNLLP